MFTMIDLSSTLLLLLFLLHQTSLPATPPISRALSTSTNPRTYPTSVDRASHIIYNKRTSTNSNHRPGSINLRILGDHRLSKQQDNSSSPLPTTADQSTTTNPSHSLESKNSKDVQGIPLTSSTTHKMATSSVCTPLKSHAGIFSTKTAGGRIPLSPSPRTRYSGARTDDFSLASPFTPPRQRDEASEPLFSGNFS